MTDAEFRSMVKYGMSGDDLIRRQQQQQQHEHPSKRGLQQLQQPQQAAVPIETPTADTLRSVSAALEEANEDGGRAETKNYDDDAVAAEENDNYVDALSSLAVPLAPPPPPVNSRLSSNLSSSQLQNLSSSVSSRSDLNEPDHLGMGSSNLSLESGGGAGVAAGGRSISTSASAGKKKTSSNRKWYSAFYPTYKSRSEDFRKNFPDLVDERLVVEYSSALQRDILVHGRMYVTLNYLCFYANIFRWETSVGQGRKS